MQPAKMMTKMKMNNIHTYICEGGGEEEAAAAVAAVEE